MSYHYVHPFPLVFVYNALQEHLTIDHFQRQRAIGGRSSDSASLCHVTNQQIAKLSNYSLFIVAIFTEDLHTLSIYLDWKCVHLALSRSYLAPDHNTPDATLKPFENHHVQQLCQNVPLPRGQPKTGEDPQCQVLLLI